MFRDGVDQQIAAHRESDDGQRGHHAGPGLDEERVLSRTAHTLSTPVFMLT
ncbi:hypothetical protein GCM10020227_04480 [Streptomyces flavovirens]